MDDIRKYNQKRALTALVLSILLTTMFFVALMMRLFMKTSASLDADGLRAYRMFTTDSNLLLAIVVLLSIPYEIDGYRKNNMHLPNWIIVLLYISVTCTTLTLIIATTVLSPFSGFYNMMLKGSNFFMHAACPLVGLILFLLVLSDHKIGRKNILWAITPVLLYAIVYAIEAFAIGNENGGWKDHYQFNVYLPWPVVFLAMILVALAIACILRILHNRKHKRIKFLNRFAYEDYFGSLYSTIDEAVRALAREDKKNDPKNNDVSVPRRILYILENKYQSGKSIDELATLYIREYLGD